MSRIHAISRGCQIIRLVARILGVEIRRLPAREANPTTGAPALPEKNIHVAVLDVGTARIDLRVVLDGTGTARTTGRRTPVIPGEKFEGVINVLGRSRLSGVRLAKPGDEVTVDSMFIAGPLPPLVVEDIFLYSPQAGEEEEEAVEPKQARTLCAVRGGIGVAAYRELLVPKDDLAAVIGRAPEVGEVLTGLYGEVSPARDAFWKFVG